MKSLNQAKQIWRIATARDWSFSPQRERAAGPPRERLIIANKHIPTIDYYLSRAGATVPQRVVFDSDFDSFRGRGQGFLRPGTQVVLVRMPASRWATVLDENRDAICESVWLIDDDVVAAREDASLPTDYRLRLLSEYLRFKDTFERRVSTVWASTPAIAARYPHDRVEVHPPQPLAQRSRTKQWVTVFYHGTAAHLAEYQFLKAVFGELQQKSERVVIEVCGDHAIHRLYRGIPRVRVLHPLPWPDYLAILEAGRYDVGLVPLLNNPFNGGRSAIKALELAALGIPAVISNRVPYASQPHEARMLTADDRPDHWVERILELVATS